MPTPDSYANEPIRFAPLQIVDLAAEAAAVSEPCDWPDGQSVFRRIGGGHRLRRFGGAVGGWMTLDAWLHNLATASPHRARRQRRTDDRERSREDAGGLPTHSPGHGSCGKTLIRRAASLGSTSSSTARRWHRAGRNCWNPSCSPTARGSTATSESSAGAGGRRPRRIRRRRPRQGSRAPRPGAFNRSQFPCRPVTTRTCTVEFSRAGRVRTDASRSTSSCRQTPGAERSVRTD